MHRPRVAGLQLPPQLGNVRVHGAAEDIGAIAPHALHETVAAHRCTIRLDERPQQIDFLGRQGNVDARATHDARGGIDDDIAELDGRSGRARGILLTIQFSSVTPLRACGTSREVTSCDDRCTLVHRDGIDTR